MIGDHLKMKYVQQRECYVSERFECIASLGQRGIR